MRGVGNVLVPLVILCTALGSQVADVEAVTKKTTKTTSPLPVSSNPVSSTPVALTASVVTAKATLARTTSADRRRTKSHRTTRHHTGPSDGDGNRPPVETATSSFGTGSATIGSLMENELNMTDVSLMKSSLPKPFIKQGAYPFIVTVQKTCGSCHVRHCCGGVLLAPQWVLSIPQCAEVHPGEGLLVRGGDSFIWPGDHSPTQKVLEVVWHDAPTSTDDYPRYDVILMRLENPFQLNENLNTINLLPPSHNVEGAVTVVGWSPPGHAQQVEVNVTHAVVKQPEDCLRMAPQEVLPSDTMCLQPVEPLLDHCAYDLGDPVILESDPPQLVGLLNRWYQPCSPERPAVAIKISVVSVWIYDKVYAPSVTKPPSHISTTEFTTLSPAITQATSTTTTQMVPVTASTSAPPTAPGPAVPSLSSTHHPFTSTSLVPSAMTSGPSSSTNSPPTPTPTPSHVKPIAVSSSSASGALANTTSTSDAALLLGHMESSLSYSLGTAGVEPGKPALSNSVSVGWANCRDVGGALGMSYALAYSFIGEGSASSASTVNATCLEINAVQSQGWSISTSGGAAPINVRAFVMEHLASIPGLPRQPTLKYL